MSRRPTVPTVTIASGGFGETLHYCAFARCAQGESVVLLDKRLFQYELDAQFIY